MYYQFLFRDLILDNVYLIILINYLADFKIYIVQNS